MRDLLLAVLFAATTVLFGACSTTPANTDFLEQTRSEYEIMRNDPAVGHYAPLEKQQAILAMSLANDAAMQHKSAEEINHLTYLAKAKIALAQEVKKQKHAESEISLANVKRDQLLSKQRDRDAEQARISEQLAQTRAAKLEAELSELTSQKAKRGTVITLGDVLFGFDQSTLSPPGLSQVRKLVQVLKRYPERVVLIEGHTDATGSAHYNQLLSERRADAVRRLLQDMGIAGERLKVRGYGRDFPAAPNDTAENRQLNRRVEIVVSDEDGNIKQRQEPMEQ